jgi:hypothetical protein
MPDFVKTATEIIFTAFKSNPHIKAETSVMGVPVWTIVIATVSYCAWNTFVIKKQYLEQKQIKNDVREMKQQIADLKHLLQMEKMLNENDKLHQIINEMRKNDKVL